MMEGFMGSEEFRLGIHNFLTKFSFKNAVTNDLFDELSAVSSQNLDIAKARKIGT
jgi:aminopeptidase N